MQQAGFLSRSTFITLRIELEYNTRMAQSIAEQLKQIRESQGISLALIAQKTHISLKYLQAIEEFDEENLPPKVQLRGFMRLYANELGVELDDLRVGGYHLSKEKLARIPAEQVEGKDETKSPSIKTDQPDLPTDSETEPEKETEPGSEKETDTQSTATDTVEPETSLETADLNTSTEIFTAIGQTLKRRRGLLSLSIKDIQENTHIREAYLSSIEAGAFNQLPSPIQAKGMLDYYADFLNLDTESILLDFSKALQLQRIEKQKEPAKRGGRSARELSPTALRLKNFFTLDLLVIGALFIIFSIFVIWGVNRILEDDSPDLVENDIPGVSDVLLATGTPTPTLNDELDTTDIDEDQDEVIEEEEEEEPLFAAELSTAPINIILLPRQRLWVEVTTDGEVVFRGRLIPGNVYDFTAQEQLDILTGNIGSLQIIFNNEDIGSPGLIGQIAELSFTEDGLVLPPAISTPTITATPETTPTPTPTPEESND